MPTASATPRRRRVPALAPDERRAALVEATVPLLYRHGLSVSTRQIAQAAGVAEGTIFGVFPDKSSLLAAALVRALDPSPAMARLDALAAVKDLRVRLVAATDLLTHRFTENAALFGAARELANTPDARPDLLQALGDARTRVLEAVATLVEPDRALLRRSPATVARMLMVTVWATTYGAFGETEPLNGTEIVELLLDGLLVRPSDNATDGGSVTC